MALRGSVNTLEEIVWLLAISFHYKQQFAPEHFASTVEVSLRTYTNLKIRAGKDIDLFKDIRFI